MRILAHLAHLLSFFNDEIVLEQCFFLYPTTVLLDGERLVDNFGKISVSKTYRSVIFDISDMTMNRIGRTG